METMARLLAPRVLACERLAQTQLLATCRLEIRRQRRHRPLTGGELRLGHRAHAGLRPQLRHRRLLLPVQRSAAAREPVAALRDLSPAVARLAQRVHRLEERGPQTGELRLERGDPIVRGAACRLETLA